MSTLESEWQVSSSSAHKGRPSRGQGLTCVRQICQNSKDDDQNVNLDGAVRKGKGERREGAPRREERLTKRRRRPEQYRARTQVQRIAAQDPTSS
jgi:hypothetical protein